MLTWEQKPCNIYPYIYANNTIMDLNKCKFRGAFPCTFSNMIYFTICWQCPSGFYVGQTRQILCKRINGHKFDSCAQNKYKIILKDFNLPGYSIDDFKVIILEERASKQD